MDATRARGGNAATEPARELGISTGGEGRRLLMADLDKTYLVLVCTERFDDAVDAVSRDAEHRVDPPIHDSFDENVTGGGSFGHACVPANRSHARGAMTNH